MATSNKVQTRSKQTESPPHSDAGAEQYDKFIKYIDKKMEDLKQQIFKKIEDETLNITKNFELNFTDMKKSVDFSRQYLINMTEKIDEFKSKSLESEDEQHYKEKFKKHEPIVIIKPKNHEQKNIKTQEDIKNNIDPVDVGVAGIKNFKKGSVIVELKNTEATKKIQKEVITKLGDRYEVDIPKPKYPTIKVVGITDKYTAEEIENKIRMQNEYKDKEKSKISVKFIKENKKSSGYNNFTVFIEVDGKTHSKMLEETKINIGWNRCAVYDHLSVLRCFNCNGYRHKAGDCKNKKSCGKCSNAHDTSECKENIDKIKCVNCKLSNDKLSLNLNDNHHAWSKECPIYKRNIESEKRKIDFLG